MSGHSKWKTIKHKKALTDAKRGKLFSKMARLVAIAAKKGRDPEMNPSLRAAVDKARSINMPNDNIERAIKKASGGEEGAGMEEALYEAYGPGGAAMLIEIITDNKNRTVSEIKFILSSHGGKMADSGSVSWMFERKGEIIIEKPKNIAKDETELAVIESGADNFSWQDNELIVLTPPEKLDEIKKYLKNKNITAKEAGLVYREKNIIALADGKIKQQLEKLYEALNEHDDVQEVYLNIDY